MAVSGNNQWLAAQQKPGWAHKIWARVSPATRLLEGLLCQNMSLQSRNGWGGVWLVIQSSSTPLEPLMDLSQVNLPSTLNLDSSH